jgi:hypothetical protein
MLTELIRLDSQILSQLTALGYSQVIIVIVLALLLAPVVYSYRLRLRRHLRRLTWISVGFALGWFSAVHYLG